MRDASERSSGARRASVCERVGASSRGWWPALPPPGRRGSTMRSDLPERNRLAVAHGHPTRGANARRHEDAGARREASHRRGRAAAQKPPCSGPSRWEQTPCSRERAVRQLPAERARSKQGPGGQEARDQAAQAQWRCHTTRIIIPLTHQTCCGASSDRDSARLMSTRFSWTPIPW